jgi:hypothetical protein
MKFQFKKLLSTCYFTSNYTLQYYSLINTDTFLKEFCILLQIAKYYFWFKYNFLLNT